MQLPPFAALATAADESPAQAARSTPGEKLSALGFQTIFAAKVPGGTFPSDTVDVPAETDAAIESETELDAAQGSLGARPVAAPQDFAKRDLGVLPWDKDDDGDLMVIQRDPTDLGECQSVAAPAETVIQTLAVAGTSGAPDQPEAQIATEPVLAAVLPTGPALRSAPGVSHVDALIDRSGSGVEIGSTTRLALPQADLSTRAEAPRLASAVPPAMGQRAGARPLSSQSDGAVSKPAGIAPASGPVKGEAMGPIPDSKAMGDLQSTGASQAYLAHAGAPLNRAGTAPTPLGRPASAGTAPPSPGRGLPAQPPRSDEGAEGQGRGASTRPQNEVSQDVPPSGGQDNRGVVAPPLEKPRADGAGTPSQRADVAVAPSERGVVPARSPATRHNAADAPAANAVGSAVPTRGEIAARQTMGQDEKVASVVSVPGEGDPGREPAELPFAEVRGRSGSSPVSGASLAMNRPELARSVAVQIAEIVSATHERAIEVKLHPEELGRVSMTLAHEGAALSITLTADRSETLDLMRRNIDTLGDELRRMGYSTVDFSFGGGGAGGGNSRQADGMATAPLAASDVEPKSDVLPGNPRPARPDGGPGTDRVDIRL